MNVNYEDDRFKQVENEKQSELNKYNETYNDLINERNNLTNQQQEMVDRWENTQKDIANKNLQYQKDLIEQQRKKAEQTYQNEAKASYIDYQKEVDKYGVSRENVVNNGLSNSGYSESSKVDMYNTYQNRLGIARKSMQDAGLEFDNAIRQAQLSNDETLAQNALTALQNKLNIILEGFNYKSEQENNRLNWNNTINNNYYNRYKDVESQINYENETAEKIRQYNEQMEYQKERDRIADEQWQKEYALQQAQSAAQNNYYSSLSNGSSGQDISDGSSSSNNGNSNGDGSIQYNGKTGYNSLTKAVLYLKNNGVKGVTTASNVKDLIAKGYLITQTINGKLYYFPNVNPNAGSSSTSSSSRSGKSILQAMMDMQNGKYF